MQPFLFQMPAQAGPSPRPPTRGVPKLRFEGPNVISNNTPVQFKLVSDKLFHGQPGCTEKVKITRHYLAGKYDFIKSGSLDGTFDPSGGDKSIWTWNFICDTNMMLSQDQLNEALDAGRTSMHVPGKLEFEYLATEKISKSLVLGRPPTAEEEARSEDVVAEYPQTLVLDMVVNCDLSFTGLMGL